MPLLGYFLFVGSALIGLLYLANAVMPRETPTHISRNVDAASPPPRRPKHATAVPPSSPQPTMSFAAVPVAAPAHAEEPQKFNAPPARVAQDRPPQKKRKLVPRKREWRDDFTQANSWSRDIRRDQKGRNGGRRYVWRDPFWGSNGRRAGWRW